MVEVADRDTYFAVCTGLPEDAPQWLPPGLLEQLLWALVTRPQFQAIVYPLHLSVVPDLPATVATAGRRCLEAVFHSGCIALMRPSALPRDAVASGMKNRDILQQALRGNPAAGVISRALLEEKFFSRPGWWQRPPVSTVKQKLLESLKSRLSIRQKIWIKNQLSRLRLVRYAGKDECRDVEVPLAKMKAWQPAFLIPRFALNIPEPDERIPVLLAVHWLELGGAEKFAVDLIRFLPADTYRIYVATDIPSANTWQARIRDHVEELIHLPFFLRPEFAPFYYSYLLSTRGIRLVHIHHAPRFYESLPYIRRHHPAVKILDTLHILELPPHSGGYPEWAAGNFEMFIDCHHVISTYLQRFLIERWYVPAAKIAVNYLNVDTDYFDPALIPAGKIRRVCNIADSTVLVGFIGRFTRQKRPLEFVKMAGVLCRRWQRENRSGALNFLMAGSGMMKEEIQDAVRRERLEREVFLLDEMADPRPVYKDSDLIVMTSENEGLALVCYEAMAMETPVFSPDVGAQSELLSPEFLVSDEQSVAEKLAEAVWPYLVDADRRLRAGKLAREYILQHHRAEKTFHEALLLYKRLLGTE